MALDTDISKCTTFTRARTHIRRRTAVELLSLRRTERMSPPGLLAKGGVVERLFCAAALGSGFSGLLCFIFFCFKLARKINEIEFKFFASAQAVFFLSHQKYIKKNKLSHMKYILSLNITITTVQLTSKNLNFNYQSAAKNKWRNKNIDERRFSGKNWKFNAIKSIKIFPPITFCQPNTNNSCLYLF